MTYEEMDTLLETVDTDLSALEEDATATERSAIASVCLTDPLTYSTVSPEAQFKAGCPSPAGDLVGGPSIWDTVSGAAPCRLEANDGRYIGADAAGGLVIFSPDVEHGSVSLTGATPVDLEAIASYVDGEGVSKFITGDIGDDTATRPTKQLYLFDEPADATGAIALSSGNWEQVDITYPALPKWSGGENIGDAETLLVADDKIWVVSKREEVAKIFSLPLADSYIGTQTLTYEGEVYPVDSPDGAPLPGNFVGGSITSDGLHVVLKTYSTVYVWTRSSPFTSIPALLSTEPEILAYSGLGDHPLAEPQGESIWFSADDQQLLTVSSSGTGSSALAGGFPIFVADRGDHDLTNAITYEGEPILSPNHCPITHS